MNYYLKPLNYFQHKGRIGRQTYWSYIAIYVLMIAITIGGSVISIDTPLENVGFSIMVGVVILVSISSIFVTIQRLHDLGKSGWLYIIYVAVPSGLDSATDRLPPDHSAYIPLIIIMAVIMIWALIELGFTKGTDGPNKYGDDPLA